MQTFDITAEHFYYFYPLGNSNVTLKTSTHVIGSTRKGLYKKSQITEGGVFTML